MGSPSDWDNVDRSVWGPDIANRSHTDARLSRAMGQLFMMGFDGTEVTPQIRTLIEQHHLGTILLTAKNLICQFSPLRL